MIVDPSDTTVLDTLEKQIRARLELAIAEGNADVIASERRLLEQIGRLETKEEKEAAARARKKAELEARKSHTPPQGRTSAPPQRITTQGGVAAKSKE